MEELELEQSGAEEVSEPVHQEVVEEIPVESSEDQPLGEGGEEEPAVDEYTPNFKYKVRGLESDDDDDDEEQEFDEWLRPVVTSKDVEEKVRDLYTKARGLDAMKPRHEKLQERYGQVSEHYGKLDQTVRNILKARDEGDYDTFLKKTNIPVGKLASWLMEKIRISQLPAEERSAYEETERLRSENRQLREGVETPAARSFDTVVDHYEDDLKTAMREDDTRGLIKDYDKRMGEKGAFEEFVIDYGSRYYRKNGKNVRPATAVRDCLRILGLQSHASSQEAQPSGQPGQTKQQNKVIPAKRPTVLPNTGSSASSPTDKRPRNLSDLKKLAKGGSI